MTRLHRSRITSALLLPILLLFADIVRVGAQGASGAATPIPEATRFDTLSSPTLAPLPGDVLTPDARTNTPNLKIALKLGFNRSSYTNDRYPDNRPFDVGNVFGEEDVYGSAAGFGYQLGLVVEIPRSTIFSWLVGLRYDHVGFDAGGLVGGDICRNAVGDSIGVVADHYFNTEIDFLKIIGGVKPNLRTFYGVAGMTGGLPLSHQIRFDRTSNGERCFYPEAADIRNSLVPVPLPEISPLHLGIRLGGGTTWDITERIEFSPELILDFGQNALNKSPESDLGVYALNAVFRIDL